MHACGDGSLIHKGDLGGPKCVEPVNHHGNAGADGLASNQGLILLAVNPASLDDAEANVEDVVIIHPEARTAGIRNASEEAERASNLLAGFQSAAMRCRFALQSFTVLLPYWLTNQRKT